MTTTKSKNRLAKSLENCRRHGREALDLVEKLRPVLDGTLNQLGKVAAEELSDLDEPRGENGLSDGVEAMLTSELREFDGTLDALVHRSRTDLDNSFDTLHEHADEVTIALFGRTMAGKSTTMEALTEGDGEAIGDGQQHCTKEVKSYHWPGENSRLRIVDTPGIEGYQGEELARMAESFVEQADHIFFLFNGDKESSGELEYFANLRSLGKGVTGLLNVRDGDLDLLCEMPEYVFDADEINGHLRRIKGYLRDNHGIDEPTVLPFHALAAWKSTQESRRRASELREVSRIGNIEGRIEEFVRREAVGARIRNPRRTLRSYILTVKEQVRAFASRFRGLMEDTKRQRNDLESTVSDLMEKSGNRLSEMKVPFEEAKEHVPTAVNTIIESTEDGRSLDQHWQQIVDATGLGEAAEHFTSEVRALFEDALQENLRRAAFDRQLPNHARVDVSDELDTLRDLQNKENSESFWRAGARTAATMATSAGGAWAATNFWNPTGWVAAAAGIEGAIVAGYLGDQGAKKIDEKWRKANQAKIRRQRRTIIHSMKSQIASLHQETNDACWEWLTDFEKALRREIDCDMKAVEQAARRLWQRCVDIREELTRLEERLDRQLVAQAARAVVPEIRQGKIEIVDVERWLGKRTKIMVRATDDSIGSLLGFCIGKRGSRSRRLGTWLGESVAWVDAQADVADQIASGLYPANIKGSEAHFLKPGTWRVETHPSQVGRAIGKDGSNVITLSKLLGLDELTVEKR